MTFEPRPLAALELDEGLTHVRYQQTPTHPEANRHTLGARAVYEPIHLNNDYLVHDRIHDLRETACELRAARRTDGDRTGLLARTRWTVGRRLISIGSAVSGQHA
jgi:hypothetical protein